MVCILCFALAGCKKIYKGTDELIEKAREEIPISDADTIMRRWFGLFLAMSIKRIIISLWK